MSSYEKHASAGGHRFKELQKRIESQGKSPEQAAAIAASAGRAKYGAKKMAKFSQEGKHGK